MSEFKFSEFNITYYQLTRKLLIILIHYNYEVL